MVLLYLFERFRVALVTLIPAVGAAAAAFGGLWLAGIELNITAMMLRPMAVAIISGLAVKLPLARVVLPAALKWVGWDKTTETPGVGVRVGRSDQAG